LRHNKNGVNGADSSFGQRRRDNSGGRQLGHANADNDFDDPGAEISWVPSSEKSSEEIGQKKGERSKNQKGGEKAFTLQHGSGSGDHDKGELPENERKGRMKRRTGIRSGSRNVFRRM
jgi:ribosome biogenesis protein ENP2